jgi:hypothetical protein
MDEYKREGREMTVHKLSTNLVKKYDPIMFEDPQ